MQNIISKTNMEQLPISYIEAVFEHNQLIRATLHAEAVTGEKISQISQESTCVGGPF